MRRFGRRLVIGLFLDIWQRWAVGSLMLAGLVTLVCRTFFSSAAEILRWFWLAPIFAALPAAAVSIMHAYRPDEIVALADSLGGGQGTLLALIETRDPA